MKDLAEICSIEEFQEEIGLWSDKTFGTNSLEIKKHLASEIIELVGPDIMEKAIHRYLSTNENRLFVNNEEESSDILLLLLHLAHREKFCLFKAAKKKQNINLKRTWLPADRDGIIRHERKNE